MQPCLAATGADPTLPIALAAALLVLGVLIAAVAIRRRKTGAALLVLALPFLVGASLLGSASPALAQPGVPCPTATPTPTPTCEPVEELPDASFTTENGWFTAGDPPSQVEALFDSEDVAAYVTTWLAIQAIDPEFDERFFVGAEQLGATGGPVEFVTGFGIDGEWLAISLEAYDEATDGFTGGIAWVDIVFEYDDGCGGTLTTTLRYTGSIPSQVE